MKVSGGLIFDHQYPAQNFQGVFHPTDVGAMAGVDERFLDEVMAHTGLVNLICAEMPLKRKGREYWGCCPTTSAALPPPRLRR